MVAIIVISNIFYRLGRRHSLKISLTIKSRQRGCLLWHRGSLTFFIRVKIKSALIKYVDLAREKVKMNKKMNMLPIGIVIPKKLCNESIPSYKMIAHIWSWINDTKSSEKQKTCRLENFPMEIHENEPKILPIS